MRVVSCPLIVALSVFVSCFLNPREATGQTSVVRAQKAGAVRSYRGQGKHRTLKQSPGTVSLRPRFTQAQPGVPTVKVTVDRRRVPLGDEVTFTLTPASVVLDPRYIVTLFFGDRTSQRVRQTEIVYVYSAAGTYTYSILVEWAAPPAQDIPRVSLSANPTPVATESPVTFTAQLSHGYPNIKYRFAFGDKNQTQWQDASQTTHAYTTAGRYLAYVDIGSMSSGGVKPLGGSVRQPVDVISQPATPAAVAVDLIVVPRSVLAGLPVFFRATTASANSTTRYRFNFGDGSPPTAWKETPEAKHIYSLAGDYPAFVEMGSSSNQPIQATAASGRKQVRVEPINPRPASTPSPSPQASLSVRGKPSPTPKTTPVIGGGETSLPSPTTSPSGTPTPTPNPNGGGTSDNWWKYLLMAVLILFAGYEGWKYFYAPRPTLVPNHDPGESQLGSEGGPLAINFQMELNPNVTDGQITVNTDGGSLIKSERNSDA